MNNKVIYALVTLGIVLAIVLIQGLVGGSAAQDIGVTCDMGVGDAFCWKWHTNAIGQVGEFFENLGGQYP